MASLRYVLLAHITSKLDLCEGRSDSDTFTDFHRFFVIYLSVRLSLCQSQYIVKSGTLFSLVKIKSVHIATSSVV